MSHAGRTAPGTSSTLREACADLGRRLRAGETATAEEYFASFPSLAGDVESAVELIYTEFATAEELGRPVDELALLERFPQWTTALRRQLDIHRLLSGADASPTLPTPSAADGERWGAYEIIRPLGHGGMSAVYLATHVELGRLAALKILNRAILGKGTTLERFRAEVRSAAALGHTGIVQLYELGELPDGRPFAAFEYVEGGSLREALGGRPRPAREAAELVRKLAESIDRAHRAGIVHCDLSPANVLLTRDGSPKIADFGLSRVPRPVAGSASEGAAVDGASDSSAADAGGDVSGNSSIALAGTPGYMAPERIEHPELATPAADLYGLGAIFYELLTGRPPHVGATPLETLRQARDFDPPSPRSLSPNIPRDLATICQKCLAREPDRRYADAAALAEDLRRFLAGEPIAARPVGSLERAWKWARRRPGLASALFTSALALAGLAVGGAIYSIQLGEALELSIEQQRRIAVQKAELDARVDRQRRDLFTLQLNQAEALLERAPHHSRRLLKDETLCPPALRDFAWGLMLRRASQERRTLLGHAAPISTAVVGPNQTLITAAFDDHVFRWTHAFDAKSADDVPPQSISVDTSDAALLVLAPDGGRLAAADRDGTLQVFLLPSGIAFERQVGAIAAMTFFSDGKWLATAGEDGELQLWDPAGTRVAAIAVADPGSVTALAASPTSGLLAVGLVDGLVKLVDANGGAAEREIAAGGAALAFSRDGRKLYASNLVDGRVTVWDTRTLEKSATFEAPGEVLRSFAVSPSGRRIALATAGQVLRVVDAEGGSSIAEYRGHADRIGVPIFLDDALLASASDDRTVKLWDVPGRPIPQFVDGDDTKTLTTAFAPDGRKLAIAGFDGSVRIAELSEAGEPADTASTDSGPNDTGPADAPIRLEGHSGAVNAVRFLADGKRLVSCSEDGSARLWDLAQRESVRRWEHPDWVLDVALEAEGEHFWTACADGTARRFAAADETVQQEFKAGEQSLLRIAWGRAEGRPVLATLLADGTVAVWFLDGAAPRVYRSYRLEGRAAPSLALSARGDVLAVGSEEGVTTLWDLVRDRKLHDLPGHTRGVYDMAFSGDGLLLATASGGRWLQSTGEIKLWDVATGQVHATLEGATAPVAFRSDDRVLAAGNGSPRRMALWVAESFRE